MARASVGVKGSRYRRVKDDVRHRVKLVAIRSGLNAQIHAVLEGVEDFAGEVALEAICRNAQRASVPTVG
jgi:hypothetical protein